MSVCVCAYESKVHGAIVVTKCHDFNFYMYNNVLFIDLHMFNMNCFTISKMAAREN